MQTDTLHSDSQTPQSHTLIASDRVEGTPVRRANGEKIGTVQRLMIDKVSGSVAYAVLSFGGFLGMGQKHAPVPWARLKYEPTLGAYHLELSDEELRGAPSTTRRSCRRRLNTPSPPRPWTGRWRAWGLP